MKVWWVLAWEQYYPSSELGNVHSTYATREEAVAVAEQLKIPWDAANGEPYRYCPENVEVVNISNMLFDKDTNNERD